MMKDLRGLLILLVLASVIVTACKKSEDPNAAAASAYDFNNPYCNDPQAVNYNHGFPGKPDNAVCFYPTDVFTGIYMFDDQIYYSEEYLFATSRLLELTLKPESRTLISVYGICEGGTAVKFTADKYYRAVSDSTFVVDSLKLPGQIFCNNIKDTLTGLITRTPVNDTLTISFTIQSDTGIAFHTGKAWKKQ
jgi:hypothetical protein